VISEKKSTEKKNIKRDREPSLENKVKQPQKKRKSNKNNNGNVEIKEMEEISNSIDAHTQHLKFHNNPMAATNTNYKFINNFNNFLTPNFDNTNLLAQKMIGSNSTFLSQYNDVLNNKNMLSLNKN